MQTLNELLNGVHDQASFLLFANALVTDRLLSHERTMDVQFASRCGHLGWKNCSIEKFLSGAIAWGIRTDMGVTQGLSEANAWQRFATLLYCGKINDDTIPKPPTPVLPATGQ